MNDPAPADDFSTVPADSQKLTFSTKLAYGAGDLGAAITSNILVFYLSPFLTDVAGLQPGLAGISQLIGKIWDAVNDPLVGVLSDRTRSAWGRRYPWMILGAIPFGVFFALHWIVPNFSLTGAIQQWTLFGYYTLVSIAFNMFYTVVNLPYTALTPELTQDYNERTSLNSFRFAFSIGGSILSVIVFGIIIGLIPHSQQQQYWVMGLVLAAFSVLPIYWCVWGTRKRAAAVSTQRVALEEPVSMPFGQQLRIILANRPFLFVVGIYLCSWLSVQFTGAAIPYFVRSWMRPSDDPQAIQQITIQAIFVVQATAMSMLFVWSAVSQKVGKKAVYFMGMTLWIVAQVFLFLLQPGQIGWMYFLAAIAGFGVSTAYLVPWSMLPDVIELDELRTGQRREGIFYSFMVFLQKVCLGIAVFLLLQSLGWAGYVKPTDLEPLPVQPDAVLLAIRLAIGPIPMISLLCGLVLNYFYPITREAHAEILMQLNERKAAQQRASDSTANDEA